MSLLQLADLGQYLKIGSNEPTTGSWTGPDGTVHHIDPAYLKPDPNWTGAAPVPYVNPAVANDPSPTPPTPATAPIVPTYAPPPSGMPSAPTPYYAQAALMQAKQASALLPAPGSSQPSADAKALLDLQAQLTSLQSQPVSQQQPIYNIQAPPASDAGVSVIRGPAYPNQPAWLGAGRLDRRRRAGGFDPHEKVKK